MSGSSWREEAIAGQLRRDAKKVDPLFAVRCSLFAVRCSLFAVRCSLLAARTSWRIFKGASRRGSL